MLFTLTDLGPLAGMLRQEAQVQGLSYGAVLLLGMVITLIVAAALTWNARQSEKDAPTVHGHNNGHEQPVEAVQVAVKISASDDLTMIEGIGPKINSLLQEAGITTYSQLADTSFEKLDEVLTAANLQRITNPKSWPAQARLAADGKMDELQALQHTLKAGREN
jgi:predicted flap endonuclease-1-like 5' DNA nuclease